MTFTSDSVVSVQGVTVFQDLQTIVSNATFEITKGEFVYLVGRTGSGKSSLLKLLYADLPLQMGEASVASINLSKISSGQVSKLRRKVGIIFQDFELLPDRPVADNLYFVMKATGWKSKQKMKQRVSEVLMRVGLDSAVNKYPHQLSGGEQQRVVIARALINEPLILIADEPTGNLDPTVGEEILKLFRTINNSGTAILMATHNHSFLEKYKERVLKLENGKLLDSKKEKFSFADIF